MSFPFFVGDQFDNNGDSQRPSFQAHYQPVVTSGYSFQPSVPGLSPSRPEGFVYAEQSNASQINGGPPSSLNAQIFDLPNVPPRNYVQMLEQEVAMLRRKNREYEATIVHQANLFRQSSLVRDYNQNVPHAFAPLTHSPVLSSNSRFSSMSGAQCENAGNLPLDYSMRPPGFDRLQLPPTTALPGIVSLPPPSWSGTQPQLMSGPNPAITEKTNYRLSSLDLDFAKRRRDSADGESELPSGKKARLSSVPTSTSSPPPPRLDSPFSHPIFDDSSTAPQSPSTNLDASHSYQPDWSVEYNPEVERTLEVNLMRTIPEGRTYRIKFSRDGQLLAILTWEGVVTLYNVATGLKIHRLKVLYDKEESYWTYDISFSSNDKYLATCTERPECLIRVWEVGKKHVRNVFKGHLDNIVALDFSPDALLLSGSWDATVRIWNMRDGSSRIFDSSKHPINSVRFSPDGTHVAAGNGAGEVLIWELRSGHLVASVKAHTDSVFCLDFMPNGEGLISGSYDKTLKYWDISGWISDEKGHGEADVADKKGSLNFVGHTSAIVSVSISPDGQWIISGSDDPTMRIWNARTGSWQCIMQKYELEVVSVHFSPAGGYFAIADYGGAVRVWSYSYKPLS